MLAPMLPVGFRAGSVLSQAGAFPSRPSSLGVGPRTLLRPTQAQLQQGQQQPEQTSLQQQPMDVHRSFNAGTQQQQPPNFQPNFANWDLDWFHYTPAWYKPRYVILLGLSFIVACNAATTPGLKTTVLAATPVVFCWFIFLYMVPKQFQAFARRYITEHPECEAKARIQAVAAQQEAEQDAKH